MSVSARSAAPPYAISVWTDGISLFAEIPGAVGKPPCITKVSHTEAGLAKLLRILATRFADAPLSDRIGNPPHPLPRQLAALATLKRLGMI